MEINTLPLITPACNAVAKILDGQALVTGLNTIAHGLGRTPAGVFVCYDDARPSYVETYRNNAQSVAQFAWVKIVYDTEVHDFGADHSAGVFTVPHSGIYTFDTSTFINYTIPTSTIVYTRLHASTSGDFYGYLDRVGSAGTRICSQHETVSLVSGETVEFQLYHESGASVPLRTGRDDVRMTVRSIEAYGFGTHDSTNIYVYSSRSRTMSFWVW